MVIPLSIEVPEPHFCKDCKFLLGNRDYIENWKDWKCSKTRRETGINLVSGEKVYELQICAFQRASFEENVCGPEGKWFELYEKPKNLYTPPSSFLEKPKKLNSLTLDDL